MFTGTKTAIELSLSVDKHALSPRFGLFIQKFTFIFTPVLLHYFYIFFIELGEDKLEGHIWMAINTINLAKMCTHKMRFTESGMNILPSWDKTTGFYRGNTGIKKKYNYISEI